MAEHLYGVAIPPRYEIRAIDHTNEKWCLALLCHGMLLRSPSWTPVVQDPKVRTVLANLESLEKYYVYHFRNGLSYALYDKEYTFKRPESAATGGAIYLDEIDLDSPELEQNGLQWILDKLDIPIVGLALSYDYFAPPPQEVVSMMQPVAPLWSLMIQQTFESMGEIRKRLPQPTALGQYIHRSGCVTRSDYEGRGLGKLFSWWVMCKMESQGYRGILAGAGNHAISGIWLRSDAPFRSTSIMQADMWQMEIDVDGEKIHPWQGQALKDFNYLLCDLTERQ